ncbi:3-ketoacyl-CoA synthase 7-like [Magnolia sinica]|uniref:3-ketoacyl-CoA synthase 7-like n=1 Tax=Magnolia sinica TaxID=86752 RepID=UPI002659EFC8|nr:3-ketoacyl-CoA synthase 7-like [Magnolia sinica]
MAHFLLQHLSNLTPLIQSTTHSHFLILIIVIITVLHIISRRSCPIYLLDFACYRPPNYYRLPISMFLEHTTISGEFDSKSLHFLKKILEKSGFGHDTCIPPPMNQLPINKSLASALEEAEIIIFSVVGDLLKKTQVIPKEIDILVLNSSLFSSTPSLSAMVINRFRLRSNIMSFNLSGMGCSAGIASVCLARDLLRVHRNTVALVVSIEILTPNWYTGKNRSMLVTNCMFRMGGVAILISSKNQDKNKSKYMLQHLNRTNNASDDRSYGCVFQDVDLEDKVGVSLSKEILHVAGDALRLNIASLGPTVLPLSEQIRYGWSVIRQKVGFSNRRSTVYMPNFKRAFEHLCIHAGGKAVIEAVEKKLGLSEEDVEASKMTLYRFGNTSSSSIWYELCYMEAKRKVKKGDRVWQISFGSGFKCNSAVWICISDGQSSVENAWTDRIHLYPVHIPDMIEID